MSERKQSPLLEYIMAETKQKAQREGSSVSVELLLMSCYEACFINTQKTQQAVGTEGAEELKRLKYAMIQNGIDNLFYAALKEKLPKETGFSMGSIILQKVMMGADARAGQNQRDNVTADIVLQEIMASPTETIKLLQKPQKTAENAVPHQAETKTEQTAGSGEEGESIFHYIDDDESETAEEIPPEEYLAALTERVKKMQHVLSGEVFGQDHAISTFVSGYFQSQVMSRSDKNRTKPSATFLFAGAPGVGKTFLAEKAAEVLELPFSRFDMSEYSDKEASLEFCGTDKVYKGGHEGNVTSFVEKNPKCVLLFDEIEKAHINVIHLFLQMLDAGRLRDNFTDREVSFKDAVIILTTNAGRQLYEESREKNLSGISRKTIIRALRSDINETTGTALFPAAICSRFASGNVVMFNHMEAHNLSRIVRTKIEKNARGIEEAFGLKIEVDDDVCTALLFAEGGHTDARTVTGRAESFLNAELFELLRLTGSDSNSYAIDKLEKIRLTVALPKNDREVLDLFHPDGEQTLLVVAPEQTILEALEVNDFSHTYAVSDISKAMEILKKEDVSAVFIEPAVEGGTGAKEYLNVEDIDSPYMDFYRYVTSADGSMPVYILQTEKTALSEEECVSFTRTGARGVCQAKKGELMESLREVCRIIHQQKSMDTLSRYNKVVSFDSAQMISDNGKTAEIRLINFHTDYAIDAGDGKKILAGVSKPDLTFDQVIGAEDAKDELRFFAEYLKHPQKYMKKGLRAPRGILLYGPPGTGKTMLAKAMAAEADMTFLTAEGGQFLKKYVGEGPEAVHELFRTARKYAPAILFIDEIDAIGKQRTGGDTTSVNEEILNALLTEMDGFRNETKEMVFVLAATNFEVSGNGTKTLDEALVRRFDRKIYVELPSRDERKQFFAMKIAENPALKVDEDKIENLAVRSTGMSLASLDSVIEMALRDAVRSQKDEVTGEMLEEAFETFNSGKEKKWDPQLLERTARHEAGHALLCYKSGSVPAYLTIVARGNYGGYMQQEGAENKGMYTKRELLGRIRTALAGRAAEIVYYGPEEGITTGARGDLETATNLARYMICSCGMDEEAGLAVISNGETGGEGAAWIRKKINELLAVELQHAVDIISENRDVIDELVGVLLEENHIDGSRMKKIFERE